MTQADRVRDRLKGVRVSDRVTRIENMLGVLKSEIYKLLTNYMYLSVDNLSVYIDVTESGEYVLNVKAGTDRLIDIGKIL